ncbi:hypothetical protein [Streptomyces niveus]
MRSTRRAWPRWTLGGREAVPLISDDEREFNVATARTRPVALGRPFTRWILRELADQLSHHQV